MADTIYKRMDQDQLDYLMVYLLGILKQKFATSNTTYTFTQDTTDKHKFTVSGSDGTSVSITIPDNNTTYSDATASAHGLMTAAQYTKLAGIADGANKTTVDTAITATGTNPVTGKAINDALANKAPTSSPSFTGSPKSTTPSAGDNSTRIATTAFVTSAIAAALAAFTSVKFVVVTAFSALPTTGAVGTFYFVPDTHSDSNDSYDEYIWLVDQKKYEKIGNTDVDLSGYVKRTDMATLTNTEIEGAVNAAVTTVFGS